MIKIEFNSFRKEIWFSDKVSLFNAFLLSNYKQSLKRNIFYKNSIFHTFLINLDFSIEDIKKNYKKNYKNEINKAIKLNIEFNIEDNIDNFITFYNQFAKEKNLEVISNKFELYTPYIIITKAIYNNQTIVMHSYLVDKDIKRVRLLHSANIFDYEDKKIIGYANKFLHHMDIQYFKEKGYKIYDFGGINLNSNDKSVIGINNFKKGFGGELVEEYNLESYLLYFLRLFK